MTKEELIKELKELKQERMNDLIKINSQHDMLINYIADLNYLIGNAEMENDNA